MNIFTRPELDYLRAEPRRLGRLATVGPDGTPHVVPLGWSLDPDATVLEIAGRNIAGSRKFRDVAATGRAALVVDDVLPPWRPRGIEIRGRAEAIAGAAAHILLSPEHVVSWGLHQGATIEATYRTRDVGAGRHG